jgi:uncharacterized protein YdeI (YjbR/CyaY-like superfamily)
LAAVPVAREFFDGFANSYQRHHVDTINGAETEATRQRRAEKGDHALTEGKRR